MTIGTFSDLLSGEAVEAVGSGAAERAAPTVRQPRPSRKSDKTSKQTHRRRAATIHAFCGPNGSGKTAAMVNDTIPTLDGMKWECANPDHAHCDTIWQRDEAGRLVFDEQNEPIFLGFGPNAVFTGMRTVVSTIALFDDRTGLPHPLYVRLREWSQVLDAEHCDLLFDEITGIAGSREAMGMPVAVQNILQQFRRRDVVLRWTAPSWARADTTIRSVTQAVTDCRGYLPDRSAGKKSGTHVLWYPKRLFKWRTFDAQDLDEFTKAKASQETTARTALRAMFVQWKIGKGSRMFAAYNTFGAVTRVGEVLDGGRCAHCGGRRPVPQCKCDTHV